MDLDLLLSSSPACSTHKQLIPGHAELAAYLAGAVPGGGRDMGTVPHLARQESLQKYLLKKVQLHPEENRVREQSPIQVCSRVSRGMNASGCRETSTAQHLQSAAPGSAEGTGQGLGKAWSSRESVRGGIPAQQVRKPSVPRGAAMDCCRVPGLVLALLLLLCPPLTPACPATCRCSPGEVDCSERGLREVPWSLSTNTSSLWLGYNFITVLGPRSFPPLPGLRLLSLVHNRLELIHSRALLGLGALQELDLSHNHLTVLTPETFLPLSSLATLNLGSNRLGELEPQVLGALPQLQVLLLQDNPWVCSCSILPLWRWLSHNREKVRGECPEGHVPTPPAHSMLPGQPARAKAGPGTVAASWLRAWVVSALGVRFPITWP